MAVDSSTGSPPNKPPLVQSTLLVVIFGVALTAMAWGYVTRHLAAERAEEIQRVHRDNGMMARAFEEHVRRVIRSADSTLLFLKHEFEETGRVSAELAEQVAAAKLDPTLNQIAVVDAGGNLVLSAVPLTRPINVSANETFKVHAASASAGLYIGKPIRSRIAGKWTVFLTRRLDRPDGSFAGTVSVGLDPAYFSDFYEGLDLGPDRAVLLVGHDGIVRARRFHGQSEIGQDLRESPMFDRIPREPAGHFEMVGIIDGEPRFASYRALQDLPLVVAVSDLTSSALAPFQRRRARYLASTLVFTLFVAAFCAVLVAAGRRERRQRALLAAELQERRRAEAALREASERYRDLFENANDAIFLLDERHRYLDANRRALELFGFAREEFVGHEVFEFIPPEQRERSRATFRELTEKGRHERFEGRMRTKDGRWLEIEVSSSAIFRDGVFTGSRDIVRDVTERKRAAEEGERLLKAVSAATEGIAITDDQDRFVFLNEAHARIFGCRQGELVGKTWRDTVGPELVPLFEANLRRTLHDRSVGFWGGEYSAVRGDGSRVPLEITATARWDDKGGYLGHICIVRDISERKQAEEKIRQGERFIRSILDTVDEGFIVVDRELRILTANQAYCGMASRSCEQVIGRHCYEITHGSDRPCHEAGEACAVREVFASGKAAAAIHRHPGPEGRLLFVETKAFPIKDDAGDVVSVIETLNNITERHLLEEERLKSQKLESIGTLAGGIAHDFNNLLQGIFGYISMAKLSIDQRERSLAMIEQAEKALHQSVSLTTQLLTFSKGGQPVRVPTALEPVIENAVKFALSGSRAEYRLDIDPGLWPVDADAGQLGQVIQNIAINADQAMPHGGSVEVTARNVQPGGAGLPQGLAPRKHVMVAIRDSGVGIPAGDLERIFDPYYTTKEKGSGLGLATSDSIVRNHEGRIVATSEIGRGSTFTLFLPASAAPTEAPQEAPAHAAHRSARVLVMDDEAIIRGVAGEVLAALGHTAALADRGETAVAEYRAAREAGRPFDVVILDLTIRGGMGGIETLAKLREIDPDVRAIASSGYSEESALSGYQAQGFAAFLKKPYDVATLQETLTAVLA